MFQLVIILIVVEFDRKISIALFVTRTLTVLELSLNDFSGCECTHFSTPNCIRKLERFQPECVRKYVVIPLYPASRVSFLFLRKIKGDSARKVIPLRSSLKTY